MKKNDVTMVNPQQIVNKGLKGCSSTRTVMTFAQKHGVPCVWWSPTRNQKVLLIDWPQFRTTWNQVWNMGTTSTGNWKSGGNYSTGYGYGSKSYKGTTTSYRTHTKSRTYGKSTGRTSSYGKNTPKTSRTTYRTTTTKRSRKAA
jgi:hypothetical protein